MSDSVFRLAVLVSGRGSNMLSIFQAIGEGRLPSVRVVLVVSNRPDAPALERVRERGVETQVINPGDFPDRDAFDAALAETLASRKVDLICLAGYLLKIGPRVLHAFPSRILNIHPALLPKFGGEGMYGRYVHEAVLKSGDPESGATVHVVDEEFDHGAIVAQERVPVLPGDTAEHLAARVLSVEHRLYPKAIRKYCENLGAASRTRRQPQGTEDL